MVQEQINALESRQQELLAKMASTDAHAAKCVKLGKKFSAQYPEEHAEYEAANAEYNSNEEALAELYAQREAEKESEAAIEHIEPMEE